MSYLGCMMGMMVRNKNAREIGEPEGLSHE